MKIFIRRYAIVFTAASLCAMVPRAYISAQENTLGKIFIRADSTESGGQKFADQKLEDTAKDLKKNHRSFTVVDVESDADYLLVVIQRDERVVPGQANDKHIVATLSARDGASWKAGIKLEQRAIIWNVMANNLMKDAEKWVKAKKATHEE